MNKNLNYQNPLVYEYRGDVLENVHCGSICVVNDKNEIIFQSGDVSQTTFFRSASKPFQALPVITTGLFDKFGLTDEELTLFCASHAGQNEQIRVLESLFKKVGLSPEDMIVDPCHPHDKASYEYCIKNDIPAKKIYHNCAGKHAALMMLARYLGCDVTDYYKHESKVQVLMRKTIAEISEMPMEEIKLGIDGCGVSVFAVGLQNIATSFLKLACPDLVSDETLAQALVRVAAAMKAHPPLIRGAGYLCGEINKDENIVAKGGAMGVYGLGLKKERIAISLKIMDGSEDTWGFIISNIFKKIGYNNPETHAILNSLSPTKMYSCTNDLAAFRECAF